MDPAKNAGMGWRSYTLLFLLGVLCLGCGSFASDPLTPGNNKDTGLTTAFNDGTLPPLAAGKLAHIKFADFKVYAPGSSNDPNLLADTWGATELESWAADQLYIKLTMSCVDFTNSVPDGASDDGTSVHTFDLNPDGSFIEAGVALNINCDKAIFSATFELFGDDGTLHDTYYVIPRHNVI